MNKKLKQRTVYLDDVTHRKLRILAINRRVTMSKVINQVLEDYLKELGKRI